MSNPWKGTKAPPWQKPGARKGNGRLQKGILAAFKAKGADAALRTHDLVTACYPWDLVWQNTLSTNARGRLRDNRRRALQSPDSVS